MQGQTSGSSVAASADRAQQAQAAARADAAAARILQRRA